ncbi:thiazole biosynthesis adenylyltransferase ThiF [Cohnella pontilimi]|uniref:Thiazole biosynthesis adenylyltransferase ThiF n=1 Tax=Cohnella pontilimi TaxID=2564100 RepID=A0A4U0FAX2_9BACL|nr:ThiF family adenylyltransferase [Cohnella pontilimi]TJY41840.1 thiazole biosynthesis adenylyltransferase ThiF [Cohnella pontilimi]
MEHNSNRYSRQTLFAPIGPEGQNKIRASRVLVVGMGALGTVLASHMVRAGVGTLRIVDRDYVELSNLQRQMLYDEEDAAQSLPKAVAAERKLAKINSDVRLEPVVADVTPLNAESLLENIDLVLDGTDNFQTRLLLNDACFKRGIPFIYGGAVSAQGMTAMLIPGRTCCLRCLIGSGEGGGGQTCDTVGVIAPVVDIIASYQAIEALKWMAGATDSIRGTLLSLEVWHYHALNVKLPEPKRDCPTCRLGQFPALHPDEDTISTMCGRDTVQIRSRRPFDLESWEQRLKQACRVSRNPFLLRAELPEGERLVLFPDGRVLVQGTEDTSRARSLYDRYIGS